MSTASFPFGDKFKVMKDCSDVWLLHLLLNGYDLKKVEELYDKVDERHLGLKITRLYAVTKEFIDIRKYDDEISKIKSPEILSENLYSLCANTDKIDRIYYYTPLSGENDEVLINDLDIAEGKMLITKEYVVSPILAKPIGTAENLGFMYFKQYCLEDHFEIEYRNGFYCKWICNYNKENKEFSIQFVSRNVESDSGETKDSIIDILRMENISKRKTYQIIIYLIRKASVYVEYKGDNFQVQPLKYNPS